MERFTSVVFPVVFLMLMLPAAYQAERRKLERLGRDPAHAWRWPAILLAIYLIILIAIRIWLG